MLVNPSFGFTSRSDVQYTVFFPPGPALTRSSARFKLQILVNYSQETARCNNYPSSVGIPLINTALTYIFLKICIEATDLPHTIFPSPSTIKSPSSTGDKLLEYTARKTIGTRRKFGAPSIRLCNE